MIRLHKWVRKTHFGNPVAFSVIRRIFLERVSRKWKNGK
nr:MAG TPA: hypothetical protein [Caudoviricetes sp.]